MIERGGGGERVQSGVRGKCSSERYLGLSEVLAVVVGGGDLIWL